MECNCGGYVPAHLAKCPSCDRIVQDDLFEEQRRTAADEFEGRLRRREERGAAIAAARISPDVGDLPVVFPDQGGPQFEALLDHLADLKRVRGRVVDPAGQVRERMEEFELDPDMALDDMLELMDEFSVGVELWTSPKRSASTKYRCRLFTLSGWRLHAFVAAEAGTAWGSLAAAIVGGFERGWLAWE